MRFLVLFKPAGGHRISQCECLSEAQCEPAPVIASAAPAASPINATRPRTTERITLALQTVPRAALLISAPVRRRIRSG